MFLFAILLVGAYQIVIAYGKRKSSACNLIENASVKLPGIAYRWDYVLPIGVCMSAYQNNGNSSFYSSEIFRCSPNGDSVLYSYYNGSTNCDESTLMDTVTANYSSFECGYTPCPYSSIKTYFQDPNNSSDCAHLPQYNEVKYVVNICMKVDGSEQSTEVKCVGETAQLIYYFGTDNCDSVIRTVTTLKSGCNLNYNTWAEIQCPSILS
eukprot:393981_1